MAKLNTKVVVAKNLGKKKNGGVVDQEPPKRVEKTNKQQSVKASKVPPKPQKKEQEEAESDDDSSKSETELSTPEENQSRVSLFVGNLPSNAGRKKVLKLFEPFGKVLGIRLRKSNGARFFKKKDHSSPIIAFVDFATEEEAKAGLAVNGATFKENVLRVNLQESAKNAYDGKRTVFVGNLKYTVTDQILHDLFSCCGQIEYVRTMRCDKGCSGTAYVCFKDNASITMAIELNKSQVDGREMRVERYTPKKQGAGAERRKNKTNAAGGAKQRLAEKANKGKAAVKPEFTGRKTNSNFSGPKSNDKKLGKNQQSKGGLSGPKLLAKKIAPRVTKITA